MPKRVWFRPVTGRLIPKDPNVDPGVFFTDDGDWCEEGDYIRRRVMKKDGQIFLDRPEPIEPIISKVIHEKQEPAPLQIDPKLAKNTFVPLGGRATARNRASRASTRSDALTPGTA